jgi:hypothetical protein
MELELEYQYKAINNLCRTPEDVSFYLQKMVTPNQKIHLCLYQVVSGCYNPFLTFLLQKNKTNQLEFPSIPFSNKFVLNEIFVDSIIEYIQFLLFTKLITTNKENIIIEGLVEINSNTFLFVDLTKCKLDIYDVYGKNHLWMALIDEMVNVGHLCNIKISPFVRDFFVENKEYMFLYNANTKYEIPVSAYVGKEVSKLNFTYVFGVTKSDNQSVMGPYYYLTNYKNAIYHGWQKTDKGKKWGVVRFAVFLGKMTLKLNHVLDEVDMSEIKRDKMLNSNHLEKLYEQLTNRITDYDGNWNAEYDSVVLPNIIIDNGTQLKEGFSYILKNYNQQHPLSYHYIDYSNISKDEPFDEDKEYNIL